MQVTGITQAQLYSPKRNTVRALDLICNQDIHRQRRNILGLIDQGARQSLDLKAASDKSAWSLSRYLFLSIGRSCKPRALRIDNGRTFIGRVFTQFLKCLRIHHQHSEVGYPWRKEQLIGSLEGKHEQWRVADGKQLPTALTIFSYWYNAVRPKQTLNGRAPLVARNGIDPYQRIPKHAALFEARDSLLSGLYLNG